MLQLPSIPDPLRYAGLFVYDFGDHTSVGYTAGEIAMLKLTGEHSAGQAYEIYRVNEVGGFELRGVSDAMMVVQDAMAFLREDPVAARRDYDALRTLSQRSPSPIQAELVLARFYSLSPENASVISYPAFASTQISSWLSKNDFQGGDQVAAGSGVVAALRGQNLMRIASCQLSTVSGHEDRTREEVLTTVHEPLQR